MSYTDSDIENKARSILGRLRPGGDELLHTVCQAAGAELENRLRRGVAREDIEELFVSAAGILAISLYMELDMEAENDIRSFSAGNLSVTLNDSEKLSAATLRKRAESMLAGYLENGGFEFMGVRG